MQTYSEAQTFPQLPQFCGSFERLTHAAPQAEKPGWQAGAQLPPEQTVPCGQAWKHDPQFWLSVRGLLHAPPQTVWPVGQLGAQAPPTQRPVGAAHTVPQPPQS